MISQESGQFLLKLARKTIKDKLEKNSIGRPKKYPKELERRAGIFVTLYKVHEFARELRGCIGLPYPLKSLIEGVIEASLSAMNDPRFKPLSLKELEDIKIEISVLTEPKKIRVLSADQYLKKIKIGRDGLILKRGIMAGLLLPQVPVEYNWNAGEYLRNLCYKAGLNPEAWMDKETEIYSFEAQVFKE